MKPEPDIAAAEPAKPKDVSGDLRARYYAAAETWAQDAAGANRASRRLAWIVAGCACACAVAEGLALAALAPLKTVVPYTILVDRRDGTAELAQGVKLGPMSEDKALTESMLVQYVLARETFDAADIHDTWRRTLLWSAADPAASYQKAFDRNDPKSLVRTLPPKTVIAATVRSVSLLSRNSALVRFETRRTDEGGVVQPPVPVTAVIGFRFTGAPQKPEARFLNPLGFQVTSYRRDVEAPVAFDPPSPTAVSP